MHQELRITALWLGFHSALPKWCQLRVPDISRARENCSQSVVSFQSITFPELDRNLSFSGPPWTYWMKISGVSIGIYFNKSTRSFRCKLEFESHCSNASISVTWLCDYDRLLIMQQLLDVTCSPGLLLRLSLCFYVPGSMLILAAPHWLRWKSKHSL